MNYKKNLIPILISAILLYACAYIVTPVPDVTPISTNSKGWTAVATNDGAFVWADASSTNAVRSTSSNQFTARCAGGVRFFANSNATVGVQLVPGGNSWSIASTSLASRCVL